VNERQYVFDIFTIFVEHPERSALIAGIFFVLWLLLRNRGASGNPWRDRGLLISATAWSLYAIYEFVVNWVTPEADMRIDMLVIVPILLVATIVGIVLAVPWPRR
jgi:hypothetical protein